MGDQKLEEVKINLRSVLMSSTVGVSLRNLKRDYEELCGETLDNRAFGFQHVADFLRSKCSDVCRIDVDKDNPGWFRAFVIADEDTKHIEELQKRTRKPAKKKSTPTRRTYPFSSSSGYMSGGGYNNLIPNYQYMMNYMNINPAMYMYNMSLPVQAYQTMPYNYNNFITSTPRVNRVDKIKVTAAGDKPFQRDSNSNNIIMKQQKPNVMSKTKKPLKLSSSSWEVFGSYVLSIMCTRKFGMLKEDIEDKYEEKFKERLPQDWVQQLENRMIKIIKDYGDGILLLKAINEGNKSEHTTVNTDENAKTVQNHEKDKDYKHGNKNDATKSDQDKGFPDSDSDSDWDVRQCVITKPVHHNYDFDQDVILNDYTRNLQVDNNTIAESVAEVTKQKEDYERKVENVHEKTAEFRQRSESYDITKAVIIPELTFQSSTPSQGCNIEKHTKTIPIQEREVKEDLESNNSLRIFHHGIRDSTLKTQSTIAALPSLFDLLKTKSKTEN